MEKCETLLFQQENGVAQVLVENDETKKRIKILVKDYPALRYTGLVSETGHQLVLFSESGYSHFTYA